MIVVLDACAAVEVVLRRPRAGDLSALIAEADWVIAPHLFVAETSNTVWKYHKYADLSSRDCERLLESALTLPDDLIDEHDMYREAFRLSCTLDHPVYDMLYLVTARRHDAMLLTLDRKLIRAAGRCAVASFQA